MLCIGRGGWSGIAWASRLSNMHACVFVEQGTGVMYVGSDNSTLRIVF
jgi:hypothetical protein